jgi:hypothetical protein
VSASKGEFTVANAYRYNESGTLRWILSHVMRYKPLFFGAICLYLVAWSSFSISRLLIGEAASEIANPSGPNGALMVALAALGVMVLDSVSALGGNCTSVFWARARPSMIVSVWAT